MAENNTLGEFSDGEDDWIFEINENNTLGEDDRIRDTDMVLGEWSDPETDDIIRNMIVDDSQWSKPEPDDMIVDDSEWSNDEPDDMNVDDSEWDDSEADDMIVDDSEWSNDEPDDMNVDDSQWSKPEPDDMFVDDSEWSNDEPDDMNVDDSERANPGVDDVIRDIQTGRGEKRKSDEPLLPEKDFYEIESVKKHHSKKFGMTATDHIIRFNTILSEIDLIESYERTQAIFQHILDDVTRDMNEKDQVRFVLRSE